MRRDLWPPYGARPPPSVLLWVRFRVGRFILEGLRRSPSDEAELGVEAVDGVDIGVCHSESAVLSVADGSSFERWTP